MSVSDLEQMESELVTVKDELATAKVAWAKADGYAHFVEGQLIRLGHSQTVAVSPQPIEEETKDMIRNDVELWLHGDTHEESKTAVHRLHVTADRLGRSFDELLTEMRISSDQNESGLSNCRLSPEGK